MKFKEPFPQDNIPPYVFKVSSAQKGSITILVDGHYLLDSPEFYEAKLVSEDQQWRMESFTEVAEARWKETFAD